MNNYPYGSQFYTQQYERDLQNIMRDAQNRLNQLHNQSQPQQVPITQNFQLSPAQAGGIRYVNDDEEVKNQTVFMDTLFINRDYTKLWLKNARGETKTYELIEIVEKDEKDVKIDKLMQKIDMLEKELNDERTNSDISEPVEDVKSKRTSSKGGRK